MSILQTVAVFVGGPLVIYAVIALLTLVPARTRKRTRYRAGQPWEYPAQWWAGDNEVIRIDSALSTAGSEGGARGTW